jgi:hypothetical protein
MGCRQPKMDSELEGFKKLGRGGLKTHIGAELREQ